MPAQDAAEHTDNDHVRQALPPLRTVVGVELALPLPPPSAHSSSSSLDSPVQSWDIPEGVHHGECSSPTERIRSRDQPSPAPHSSLSSDANVRPPGEGTMLCPTSSPEAGPQRSSRATTVSSPVAPHSAFAESHNLGSTEDTRTQCSSSGSERETHDASFHSRRVASRFSWDSERDARMDLDPAGLGQTSGDQLSPHLRNRPRGATLPLHPANWHAEVQSSDDQRIPGSRSSSDTDSHGRQRVTRGSPMSLDSLLLHDEDGPPQRPQLKKSASAVCSLSEPHDTSPRVSSSTHSLPASPRSSRSHRALSPTAPTTPATPPPAYAFNVLRPSPGGLITSAPVRARPRSDSTRSAAAGPASRAGSEDSRRHVCPLCHKRFNRPSSLRTHASVHNGSRPYPCQYPGCTRAFSVASNMRRHLRTHFHGDRGDAVGKRGGASDGEVDMEEPEPKGHFQWVPAYEGPA